MKSLSFEAQPEELEEQPLSPMHYARSGLGTAALNGKFVAAGQSRPFRQSKEGNRIVRSVAQPSRSATLGLFFFLSSGGYNREECLRTVECYDPKEDRWTFIAPMRTPRARFQMAVLMVEKSFLVILY